MKRCAVWIFLTVMGGLILLPGPAVGKAREGDRLILCTTLPIYIFTLNVVGKIPGVRVDLLLPPNLGCPHDYDLSPGEIKRLSRADVIVINGLGLETFLGRMLKGIGPRVPVITATHQVTPLPRYGAGSNSDPVKVLPGPRAYEHGQEGSLNDHAWVSPHQGAVMVRTIAEGLAETDPLHAGSYRANGTRYAQRLEALGGEMKAFIDRVRSNKVLTVHDSLAYLARDIGLEVAGVIQVLPGVDPSPREMARLVRVIRDQQVAAIFSEPQYSEKMARTLSRETGVGVWSLDTVATGKPAPETYERAMKKNLDILRRALR